MTPTKTTARKRPASAAAAAPTSKTSSNATSSTANGNGGRRRGSVVAELLGPTPAAGETVVELPLSKVRPDPRNVRGDLGDVGELAKSIAEKGVLQPIVVTVDGDGWMVVFGHRRLAASRSAKRATIPAIVRELTPAARLEEQLIENLHRSDLTAIEEADGYRRLVEELGVSQRTLGVRVSRSQPHISKRMRLLQLPARIQAKVAAREISLEDADHLTRLAGLPDAGQLIGAAVSRANGSYGGMRAAVDETIRRHEQAQARAASLAKLERDKVRVVEYREYGWSNSYTPIGKSWDQLDVSRETCRKDGTLAAAVKPDGTVVWVCTDAARYHARLDDTPGETAAAKRERLEDERAAAAAKEAFAARTEAARSTVAGLAGWKFPPGGLGPVIRLLAAWIVFGDQAYYDQTDLASILGLPDVVDDDGDHFEDRIVEFARRGDTELLQTAVAIGLYDGDPGPTHRAAWCERPAGDDGNLATPVKPAVAAVFELLEFAGYQPTGWELDKLGRTPAAVETAPARGRTRKAS